MADKNLQETIAENVAETKATETVTPPAVETNEELTPQATETNAGETVEPEYVSGIDISDVPDADRPRIRELLGKKAGLLEKGYNSKFQEVAELKRAMEDLERRGMTTEDAQKVLDKAIYEKNNPPKTAQQKKADKLLDKLIAQSPDQRANLEQFRQLVKEESGVKGLQDKLNKLEQTLNTVSQTTTQSMADKLNSEIDALSQVYGEELVNKHRNVILKQGLQYPGANAKTILFATAPDEIEQAITAKQPKAPKPVTVEKKNAITSKPTGVTGMDTVNEGRLSLKDTILGIARKK